MMAALRHTLWGSVPLWGRRSITRRINDRNRLWGHLFGGRYKAILIEGSLSALGHCRRWQRDYLSEVIDYVHLN